MASSLAVFFKTLTKPIPSISAASSSTLRSISFKAGKSISSASSSTSPDGFNPNAISGLRFFPVHRLVASMISCCLDNKNIKTLDFSYSIFGGGYLRIECHPTDGVNENGSMVSNSKAPNNPPRESPSKADGENE